MNNAPEVAAALMRRRIRPTTRMVVDVLAEHFDEWVSTERIIDAVYSDRAVPANSHNCISVALHYDRPTINLAGYDIEVQKGGSMGGSWRRLVRA
jgi:hypothetical protein